MISFRCQHCKTKIRVPDTFQGKRVMCPGCKSPVAVAGSPVGLSGPNAVDRGAPPADAAAQQPAPAWIDYIRASSASVIISVLIMVFGIVWLLDTLGIITGWKWLWPSGLAISGVIALVAGGINKQSMIVGPYLLICAGFAVLRQTGHIELKVEIPSLVIAFGALLLVVTLAGYALPDVLRED